MARPTALEKARAELAAARDEVDEFDRRAIEARRERDEMREDRDRWRGLRLPDPESEALAGCVRAIEEMRAIERDRSVGNISSMPFVSALDRPEGRILLSLAARYGLAIVALDPPPIDPAEGVVGTIINMHETLERMRLAVEAGQAHNA